MQVRDLYLVFVQVRDLYLVFVQVRDCDSPHNGQEDSGTAEEVEQEEQAGPDGLLGIPLVRLLDDYARHIGDYLWQGRGTAISNGTLITWGNYQI